MAKYQVYKILSKTLLHGYSLWSDSVNTFDLLSAEVKKVHIHPNYNVYAKREKGVKEFYDYDVALIELKKDAPIATSLR